MQKEKKEVERENIIIESTPCSNKNLGHLNSYFIYYSFITKEKCTWGGTIEMQNCKGRYKRIVKEERRYKHANCLSN